MTDQIQPSAPARENIGAQMANVMFNLAQKAGHTLTYDDAALFDRLRKQWDAATPAPAPADHATVEQWEAALTAVMPSDFKDWHQNSRREWPNIAAHVIGNLRQREDEAWATVERLTATAPAPATGKPGLQVEQAQAVPVGAEPVSLDAAVRLGLEYAREALATHDQQFANHPATALERWSIVADIATMEASLASPVAEDRQETIIGHSVERGGWCVYSHYHGGDYTFEMGPFATRGGAEAAVRAPQAPQQAECPECIEQARLLGAGSERELALMAEVDRLKSICAALHDRLLRGDDDRELIDLAAQAWDGGQAPQQAELTDEQIYAVDRQVMEGAQTGGYILALCRAVIAEDRALRTPGMKASEPEWVVNSLGELGVHVNGRYFFLYKGDNIEYDGTHDDGSQMMVRPVGKREFGETCKPITHLKVQNGVIYDRTPYPYRQELTYTPGLSFGQPGDADWRPLPPKPQVTSTGWDKP